MSNKEHIYVISTVLLLQKGSQDPENHCGYLISLVSVETPSVKTSETKP